MKNAFVLLGLFWIMALLHSCSDPILTGSDLSDDIGLVTETTNVSLTTVLSDSLVTYIERSSDTDHTQSNYTIGQLSDSDFGSLKSSLFFNATLTSILAVKDFSIDSIILSIPLDSSYAYGPTSDVSHSLKLYELDPQLGIWKDNEFDTLYTTDVVAYDETNPIAEIDQIINYTDSIDIINPQDSVMQKDVAQLRFQLDTSVWSDLLRDSVSVSSNENFSQIIGGYGLVSEPTDMNSMIGLSIDRLSGITNSGIIVYYTRTDTLLKGSYIVNAGMKRHNYIDIDNSSSFAYATLNDSISEKVYLQSQGAFDLVLDLSSIVENYRDKIVNYATVDINAKKADNADFPNTRQVFTRFVDIDGTIRSTTDVTLASQSRDLTLFGGSLEAKTIDGVDVDSYSLNVTNHIKQILSGDITSTEIIITTEEQLKPSRAVIYNNHPTLAPSFKIIFSNP